MDEDAAPSLSPPGLSVVVSSQQSTPVVKTEASSEEGGTENGLMSVIKSEPEDEEMQTEESEMSESSMFNLSNDAIGELPGTPNLDSNGDMAVDSSPAIDPWAAVATVKQEPDVVIERDDLEALALPQAMDERFKDPRPVMMVKSHRATDDSSNYSSDANEESFVDIENVTFPAGSPEWLVMLNKKALCLVCSGPCVITKNRKIPSLPFCKKCKKSYFYQLNHISKGRGARDKNFCPKGGKCPIDYRNPRGWCHVCHLNKFRSFLIKAGGFTMDTLLSKESEIQSQKFRSFKGSNHHHNHRTRRRPETLERTESGEKREASDPMDKNLVVKVRKLTSEDLESYGVTLPAEGVTVKEEPLDIHWDNPSSHLDKPAAYEESVACDEPAAYEESAACDDSASYELPPLQTRPSPFGSPSTSSLRSTFALESQGVSNVQKAPNPKPKFVPRIAPKPKKKLKPLPKSVQQNAKTGSMASLKVYVFTCGHACSVCNTSRAKQWLTSSGFHATSPVIDSFVPAPRNSRPKSSTPQGVAANPTSNVAQSADHVQLKKMLSAPPVNLTGPKKAISKITGNWPLPFHSKDAPVGQKVMPLTSLNSPLQLMRLPALSQSALPQKTGNLAGSSAHPPDKASFRVNTVTPITPIPALIASKTVSLSTPDGQPTLSTSLTGVRIPGVAFMKTPLSVMPGNGNVQMGLHPIGPFSFFKPPTTSSNTLSQSVSTEASNSHMTSVIPSSASDTVALATAARKPVCVPAAVTTLTSSASNPSSSSTGQIAFAANASVATSILPHLQTVSVSMEQASSDLPDLGVPQSKSTFSCPVTADGASVSLSSSQISGAVPKKSLLEAPNQTPSAENETLVLNVSQGISNEAPVSDSSQTVSDNVPASGSSKKDSDNAPVSGPFQNVLDNAPVSGPFQNVLDNAPVSNSSQKISDEMLLSDSPVNCSDKTSVLNLSQKISDKMLLSDSSQKISSETPVMDPLQNISEDMLLSDSSRDSSQKISDDMLLSDSSQKISENMPVSDSCEKVSKDILLSDPSQNISENILATDSSQKVSKDMLVSDSSKKIAEDMLLSDSSQKFSEDLLLSDSSQKVLDKTPANDPSQSISEDLLLSDSNTKISKEMDSSKSSQKDLRKLAVGESSQNDLGHNPISNSDETLLLDSSL